MRTAFLPTARRREGSIRGPARQGGIYADGGSLQGGSTGNDIMETLSWTD